MRNERNQPLPATCQAQNRRDGRRSREPVAAAHACARLAPAFLRRLSPLTWRLVAPSRPGSSVGGRLEHRVQAPHADGRTRRHCGTAPSPVPSGHRGAEKSWQLFCSSPEGSARRRVSEFSSPFATSLPECCFRCGRVSSFVCPLSLVG